MAKGGLMLFSGDSFTWTSVTNGENLYTTKTWRAVCTNYGNVKQINKGIGATTSRAMVTNLQWLFLHEADVVTIGVGMNDAKNNIVPVNEYKANLRIIVDYIRTRKSDTHIILCTPGRTTDPARVDLQLYRDAMTEISVEKKTSLCRFENAYTDDEILAMTNADELHPNINGMQRIFEQLYPVVQTGTWLSRLK